LLVWATLRRSVVELGTTGTEEEPFKKSIYKLINLSAPGRHILKLEFQDNNTELFAFTFG